LDDGRRFQIGRSQSPFDLRHSSRKQRTQSPIKDKGWQDAWKQLSAQDRQVRHSHATDVRRIRPVQTAPLTKLNFTAENIRNVKSGKGVYPSPVELEGVVFDKGSCKVQRRCRFSRQTYVALKGDLEADQITLDYFKPIAERL